MSRWEFLRQLEELLSDISPSEREEALQYYNDYFNDAGWENEEKVIEALGTPQQVAQIVREGIGGGEDTGEFTENGFSSGTGDGSQAVIKTAPAYERSEQQNFAASSSGENPGSGQFQNDFQGSSQFQSGPRKSGQFQKDAGENSQSQNGNPKEGTSAKKQSADRADRNIFQRGYEALKKEFSSMPVWGIVLFIILLIICLPVVLSVAGGILSGIAGVLTAIVITFFSLILGFGAAAVVLLLAAIILIFGGIFHMISYPLAAIGLVGMGLICAGLGLLFLLFAVFLAGKVLPACCMGIVKLFSGKGGAAA